MAAGRPVEAAPAEAAGDGAGVPPDARGRAPGAEAGFGRALAVAREVVPDAVAAGDVAADDPGAARGSTGLPDAPAADDDAPAPAARAAGPSVGPPRGPGAGPARQGAARARARARRPPRRGLPGREIGGTPGRPGREGLSSLSTIARRRPPVPSRPMTTTADAAVSAPLRRAHGGRSRALGPAGPGPRRRASSSSSCPAPLASAPIELTRVGKWIERVETLRLDGVRPTSKALAARLAAFWLPSADGRLRRCRPRRPSRGGSRRSPATELGDRRPHSGGHWLKSFRSLDGFRIWWAPTDAPEEYEDALLDGLRRGRPGPRTRRLSPTRRSSCRSRTCADRPASARRPA